MAQSLRRVGRQGHVSSGIQSPDICLTEPRRFGSHMRSRILARFGPVECLVECGERIAAQGEGSTRTGAKA
jgi:hypothetical protein